MGRKRNGHFGGTDRAVGLIDGQCDMWATLWITGDTGAQWNHERRRSKWDEREIKWMGMRIV
jgi:hypothetical protein